MPGSKEKLKELVHEKLKKVGSNQSTLDNSHLLFEALWNKTIPANEDYKLTPGQPIEPLKLHEAIGLAEQQLAAERMIGINVVEKYGSTPEELKNDGVRILTALDDSRRLKNQIKDLMGLLKPPAPPKEVPKNERN